MPPSVSITKTNEGQQMINYIIWSIGISKVIQKWTHVYPDLLIQIDTIT
jgi:hypothetical protein